VEEILALAHHFGHGTKIQNDGLVADCRRLLLGIVSVDNVWVIVRTLNDNSKFTVVYTQVCFYD